MNIRELSYEMVDKLYDKIVKYVESIQGEKGYVDTQDNNCDPMYVQIYTDSWFYNLDEMKIRGIMSDGKDLFVVAADDRYVSEFTEEDLKECTENYNTSEDDDILCNIEQCWQNIRENEFIHFISTLFSIAETIEEY